MSCNYNPHSTDVFMRCNNYGTESTLMYVTAFSDVHCPEKLEPWDLFEQFTNVAPVYKPKCYAPTTKQAKAKKSYTCTGRIRGNYY